MDIELYNNKKPTANDLVRLYLDAGWGTEKDYINSKDIIDNAIKNSNLITAYNKEKLVGFLRFLSDGYHDTTIIEFIVDRRYQNNGIGSRVLQELVKDYGDTSIYINSTEITTDFFNKRNFRKHKLVPLSYRKQ